MKNILCAAAFAAGVLTLIVPCAAVAAAAESGKPATSAKTSGKRQIERGRYMVQTGHCNNCHTAGYTKNRGNVPEKEWLLGNPVGYRTSEGTTYASNLRLSVQNFTEEQWTKYATTARPRPPMPWWALRDTTEQDLRAMYQYIKHLGPAGEPAKLYVPPDQEPKPPYELRRVVQ